MTDWIKGTVVDHPSITESHEGDMTLMMGYHVFSCLLVML